MFKDENIILDRHPKESKSTKAIVGTYQHLLLVARLENENELTCFFKKLFPKPWFCNLDTVHSNWNMVYQSSCFTTRVFLLLLLLTFSIFWLSAVIFISSRCKKHSLRNHVIDLLTPFVLLLVSHCKYNGFWFLVKLYSLHLWPLDEV